MGILLIAISLMFIIATAYTLFLHTDEGNRSEAPPAEEGHSWTAETEESEEKKIYPEWYDWSGYSEGFEGGGSGLDVPHSGSR